ncbi:putative sensory transduction regulator [Isoptericola jiangsuensis]|uniref:Putative sensory transduction regulator n=1 Tax=Isoptericola jiangsuensis TaxID=548579 RepID=A0A2A9EVP1_9MICO|nr:YbjN domain-containing protein [Isoptericola jiangsuensis]PFG42813.1 putative sensory transduction regulator [Isoptericola jiangsuensis]
MSPRWRRALESVRRRGRADAPADLPGPLRAERIGDELVRRGYRFRTDDDGDLTGTWDGNRFWFLLLGEDAEILQVRGRWAGTLPDTARPAVLQACNDWNRERLWPKVYARAEDEGLALYGEVSVDLEHGVTDDQIAETLSCGLVTTSQFFASVATLADAAGS